MSSSLLQSPRAVLHSSESQEWYTRQPISDAARRVLGRIDLDPASSPAANEVVCAGHYFTPADDGLAQRWYGRVWFNPPYGKTVNKSNQRSGRSSYSPSTGPATCARLSCWSTQRQIRLGFERSGTIRSASPPDGSSSGDLARLLTTEVETWDLLSLSA